MVERERPSASLRSKPALNERWPPVRTTTEVSPSSSKLRAAAVSSRSACGDRALMPSPRSKCTTATRLSGPSPFSILTNSITHCSRPGNFGQDSSQMAGALPRRLAVGYWKADGRPDRDPVGVFAGDVVAVYDIDREDLVRPIAHAGLETR